MLPDMSDTLTEWEQPVILKTRTVTTVDFNPTEVITATSIMSVVQVAEKEKLNIDSLDWSKSYKWFHSKVDIDIDQFIEYKNADFKIVGREDFSDYGYFAVVGEETKLPLLVQTT